MPGEEPQTQVVPHNQLPDVLEKSFFSSLEGEHLANVKGWKEHEAPVSQEESEVHLVLVVRAILDQE